MDEFIVTVTERYSVMANSLDDARFVWRQWSVEREFEDDIEFLDGSSMIEPK